MAIWNERPPIPQVIVHELRPDGTLGDEMVEQRVSRSGVVREVEASVFLNLQAAKSLIVWLQDKVERIEKAAPQAQKAQGSAP